MSYLTAHCHACISSDKSGNEELSKYVHAKVINKHLPNYSNFLHETGIAKLFVICQLNNNVMLTVTKQTRPVYSCFVLIITFHDDIHVLVTYMY